MDRRESCEALMSSIIEKRNWTIVLALALSAGCKVGAPPDRNVQVSRYFGGEDSPDNPPQTRLTPTGTAGKTGAAGKPGAAGVMQTAGVIEANSIGDSDHPASEPDGDPIVQSLTDSQPQKPIPRAVAHKPPGSSSADLPAQATADVATGTSADLTSPEAQLMQAAGLSDDELADLLSAFRGSPPEVQQQAIRQLIAAASVRASQTKNPGDITEQLKNSLGSLPQLPDDIPDSAKLPLRLAATSSSTTPELDDKAGEVTQAVVSAAAAENPIAKASSTTAAAQPAALPNPAAMPIADPVAGADSPPVAVDVTSLSEADLYEQMVAKLSAATPGESQGDRFRREVVRRYLLVLSGDPDGAVESMEDLTKPEQEFLRHQLLALWNMTDPQGHPVASRRFASALPQLRVATRHLAEATEQLDVRSLAFCTEIVSFGQVKRFTSTRFDAGQKVILYCEVDNFKAEKTADGYETELKGSYEIYDDNGIKVAGQVLPADRQVCDHYLRDYFIAYQMNLPSQLAPGNYRLQLTMECEKGKKYGQASLPLEIKK